jgi:hypothetical protein
VLAGVEPDALQLEEEMVVEEARAPRVRYLRTQEEYARDAGYGVRNVKKWIELGKGEPPEVFDPPPLDNPAEMPAWWERMRSAGRLHQKCPDRILQWASKVAAAPSREEGSAEPVTVTRSEGQQTSAGAPTGLAATGQNNHAPPSAQKGTERGGEDVVHDGFAGVLRRAYSAETRAHKAYEDELAKEGEKYDAAAAERRRREWTEAAEAVRKLEKDKEAILATSADFGRWSDFEQVAGEKLQVLNQSLRSIPVRLATKLAMSTEQLSKMTELFHAELDRLFKTLAAEGFRKPVGLGEELRLEA